jgi:hypothetical protein
MNESAAANAAIKTFRTVTNPFPLSPADLSCFAARPKQGGGAGTFLRGADVSYPPLLRGGG